MKCPYCGQEHPDDFMFCPISGQPLKQQTKKCPSCEYGNVPIEAKFCPRCGNPFSESTKSANDTSSSIVKLAMSDMNANGLQTYEQIKLSKSEQFDKTDVNLIINWLINEYYKENGVDWSTDSEMIGTLMEIVNKSIDKYNASPLHRVSINIPYVLNRDRNGRPVHTRNFERNLSRKVFYALKYPDLIEDESWGWISVSYLMDSLCLKRSGNKYGVVDSDGVVILPCEYENISQLESGNIVIKKGGKYGIVNKDRSINIACKYDQIKDFIGGLCEVKLGNKWYKIDTSGIIVEIKESDGWRYSIENGWIKINGVTLGKTDISNFASTVKMEGLGEILCYNPSIDDSLAFFQRVNQDYASVVVVSNSEEYIKMKKTVRYLGLNSTKYRNNNCVMSVYQTNDLLWKFAFVDSEKNLDFCLVVEYAVGTHIIIENTIKMFSKREIN